MKPNRKNKQNKYILYGSNVYNNTDREKEEKREKKVYVANN